MKLRTTRPSLEELLTLPLEDLYLHGADGDEDDPEGDPDADEDDLDDDDPEGGDEDEDEDDEDDEDDKSDEVKGLEARIAALEDEKKRYRRQRQTAITERDAARAEAAKLKRDGVKDDDVKGEVTATKSENEKLKTEMSQLRIANAFLQDKSKTWADPKAALKLIDLSQVEIDDDGTVHGMSDAIAAAAEDYPFLIVDGAAPPKKKTSTATPPKKTATPPKKTRQTESQRLAEEKKLLRKFPALRR